MSKKKERKHSLNVSGRSATKNSDVRSAATVRRLKMYNTKPKRNSRGRIQKHDLQSKELPSTRIQPDRRWFMNTRVVDQKKLEYFRDELADRLSNNYNVLLKQKKLPLSLLKNHQKPETENGALEEDKLVDNEQEVKPVEKLVDNEPLGNHSFPALLHLPVYGLSWLVIAAATLVLKIMSMGRRNFSSCSFFSQ